MNTYICRIPNGERSTFDHTVRLRNFTGHVVIEINKQGVFLVDGHPCTPTYKPLNTEQLREMLATWFAEGVQTA